MRRTTLFIFDFVVWLSAAGLVSAGIVLFYIIDWEKAVSNHSLIYVGAWIAWATLFRAWEQVRGERLNRTFEAIQRLRTDQTYLRAAAHLRKENVYPANGSGLTQEVIERMLSSSEHEVGRDLGSSAKFLLDQFEFLAAATRNGSLDEGLLKETIGMSLEKFVESLVGYISAVRERDARTWANLMWLYYRFAADRSREWQRLGAPIRR